MGYIQMALGAKPFPGIMQGWEKRISDIKSIHNTTNTLMKPSCVIYNALRLYHNIMLGKNNIGGYGKNSDGVLLAEILESEKSSVQIGAVTKNGIMYGGISKLGTGKIERYILEENAGTVFFLALMQEVLKDTEASEIYKTIHIFLEMEPTDANIDEALFRESLQVLTDNIYHRFVYNPNAKLDYRLMDSPKGQVKLFNHKMIDAYSGMETFRKGKFLVLAGASLKATTDEKTDIEMFRKNFDMKYDLSEEEIDLIPEEKRNWILEQDTLRICRYIKGTHESNRMRNFLIYGAAGVGKRTMASIIAYELGMPKVTITREMNNFEMVSRIVPVNEDECTNLKKIYIYTPEGELNLTELCQVFMLPNLEDIKWDPEGACKSLAGMNAEDELAEEYLEELLYQRVFKLVDPILKRGYGQFIIEESEFLKAVKNGWLIELRMQNTKFTMMQESLGLIMSLLKKEENIILPDGNVLKRHPDTVLIITSETGQDILITKYMDMVFKKCSAPAPVMAQSAMESTGFKDFCLALKMAEIIYDIAEYSKSYIIGDICYQEILNSWIVSILVDGEEFVERNLINCVIEKISRDEQVQKYVRAKYISSPTLPCKKNNTMEKI